MLTNYIFRASQVLKSMGFDLGKNNPSVFEFEKKIKELGGINFNIEVYPDGGWAAESTNVDGIITGGKDIRKMNEKIKDAIFTYFELPPYLCDDELLRGPDEPLIFKERVLAVK